VNPPSKYFRSASPIRESTWLRKASPMSRFFPEMRKVMEASNLPVSSVLSDAADPRNAAPLTAEAERLRTPF
jgi:hypothetical protein